MKAVATALVAAGMVMAGPALAQGKKSPQTEYWISAATGEGAMMGAAMAGMDLGAMMGAAMMGNVGAFGGNPNKQRSLTLQLASPKAPTGAPQAAHEIPAGMNMGTALPLKTPKRERPAGQAPSEPSEASDPGVPETPEGRITIYWGCGAKVRSGQPRVLDMASANPAEVAKAFSGRSSRQHPLGGRTVGVWPNPDSSIKVPASASLQGAHRVSGNYTPDIKFTVGAAQDFMAPVRMTMEGGLEDAIVLTWEAIPTAIGQFVSVMSSDDEGGMVLWSSSNVQEPGWGLHDYLPSGDVDKWVKEGVLMAPKTTTCTIPKGIFAKSDGGMLRFTAYGRDLNVAWPEKPKDPEWAVKLRLKSTAMLPLGAGEEEEEEETPEAAAPTMPAPFAGVPAAAPPPSGGRSYTAMPRQAQPVDGGRSYTATPRQAQPVIDPNNPAATINNVIDAGSKLMGLFGR